MMTQVGSPSGRRTATQTAQTWGGTALVVGGIAVAGAYLAHPAESSPETVASLKWILIHVGFLVSLIGGVFGLVALLGRFLRAGGGLAGLIGFIAATISMVLVAGLDYAEVFIFPTLAAEYPDVVARYGEGTMMPSIAFAFPTTGVLFVIGFVLFAHQIKRVGAASAAACTVTMAGTIVFGVGLSGLVPLAVVKMGAAVFGLGLVLLGRDVLTDPTA